MQRYLCLLIVGLSVGLTPVLSQERPRRSAPASPMMQIPSEATLERDAVTSRRNEFSKSDALATKEMNQQNKRIDREMKRGICTGC